MPNQENALYWVSCNACSAAIFSKDPIDKEPIKMLVSNCGCFFCSRCAKSCSSSGCFVCGSKSKVKVVPIGKNLPQNLLEMFNNTETSISKMHKRMAFQNLHFERALKLRWKKRKNFIEKLHNFDSSQAKRFKRTEALKKMEAKLKHKKAVMSRMNKTKISLETKRNQQKRMLRPSETTNKTIFAGAINSAPPPGFLSPEQPPASFLMSPPSFIPHEQPKPSSKAGFLNWKNWF